MRTLIVGSGPTGLLLGAALARRGHQVTSVDRDPGPTGDAWTRRGVMQFEHAHGFRPQVPMTLQAEWPEASTAGDPSAPGPSRCRARPGPPGAGGALASVDLRASAAPRGREAARAHLAHRPRRRTRPRARTSHRRAGRRVPRRGRPRRGRLGPSRAPEQVEGAGRPTPSSTATAASRTSTAPTGSDRERSPGPMVNPIAYVADFDGYQCLVFLHESGHFSVVLVRPTADAALKALRFEAAFEAACRAIPALAEWTDRTAHTPPRAVLVGGALRNVYRRQAGTPGLVAVGDSVATTTPTRGRGIAMACMQITALLALLDEGVDAATGRRTVRRLVRPQHRTLGRRPHRDRRRHGQALAGRGPRPERPADLRPHRRGGRGRPPDRPVRREATSR